MKIAFVIYNWSESRGGVERYAYNLADYLVKSGDEVHVFCHRIFEPPKSSRIILYYVPAFPFYSPLKYLFFAKNAARMLNGQDFDIIQHFGRTYCLNRPEDSEKQRAAAQVYRIGSGCHWEYLKHKHPSMNNIIGRTIQCLNPRNQIIMLLERRSFSGAQRRAPAAEWALSDKLVFNSKQGKKEAQMYYRISEEHARVIYNGVDLSRFNPGNRGLFASGIRAGLRIGGGDSVLLFVGNNFETKGLRFAIEGLALVPPDKRSDVKLLVVGRGDPSPYRALARKCHIEPQVLFAGVQEQIERYYAAADIFLYPTLHDPFATVCLEAMASGLPVITTRVNGASEIISDAIDSFVIDASSDIRAIAEKIIFLLDPVWRGNMSRAAALTASRYSFEDNFRQIKEVYKKVVC